MLLIWDCIMRYLMATFLLLFVLGCRMTTERIDGYEIHGIDISHYQGRIDWNAVADQRVHFAIHKATEGSEYQDSLFARNWPEIERVGLYRGAYHFFRPEVAPEVQALNFTRTVHLKSGDLPPVLDVEVIGELSASQLQRSVQTWLTIIETHYGIRPILYSGQKFYNQHLQGHFDHYPLWIARYSSNQPDLNGTATWKFWQYGDRGQLKGIHGPVDFNVFDGSLHSLRALTVPDSLILTAAPF